MPGTDGAALSARRIQVHTMMQAVGHSVPCGPGCQRPFSIFGTCSGEIEIFGPSFKFAKMLPSWYAKIACCTRALAYLFASSHGCQSIDAYLSVLSLICYWHHRMVWLRNAFLITLSLFCYQNLSSDIMQAACSTSRKTMLIICSTSSSCTC